MRINFDRLSKLAGLPNTTSSSNLNENAQYEADMENEASDLYEEEAPMPHSMGEGEEEEEAHEGEEEEAHEAKEEDDQDEEEMLDIDEAMLVQELRRMKNLMNESKRRKRLAESRIRQRKQALYEAQLRQIIDEEVQNVLADMNYSSGWVYGDKKPTQSRNGYSHQGSFISGPGFKR
jgi:hypothetical protein